MGYSLVSAFSQEENTKGGIAIYRKTSMEMVESLNVEKKSTPLVCEITGASLRLQEKETLFVLAVYCPPHQNRDLSDQAFIRHNEHISVHRQFKSINNQRC